MNNRYSRSNGGGSNSSSAQAQKKATTEKNQQVLRKLLNDAANKYCADCKTTQHPRWASWSIGVFLCIRCSGIHRGMGTHVSKVRSIDLDSWSDEHMEKMVTWGNRRANLYWESKLPPNYVPDEAKIQNFIKTKYDLKRWVMPGPMPDPATLDDKGDESVPLSQVQKELNQGDRAPAPKPASTSAGLIPDLLSGDGNSSSNSPAVPTKAPVVNEQINTNAFNQQQPKPAEKRPPKIETKTSAMNNTDSLLGLDFSSPPGSGSPTSTGGSNASPTVNNNSSGSGSDRRTSRPDLKKSILSLYSNPRPQQQQPQQQQQQAGQFFDSFQMSNPQQHQTKVESGMFDSLTSGANNLSLNSNNNNNINTTTNNNITQAASHNKSNSGLFDSLLTSSSASAWASSTPTHGSAASPPMQTTTAPPTTSATNHNHNTINDDWSSFKAAPNTATAHQPAKPLSGLEDELFSNVWQ